MSNWRAGWYNILVKQKYTATGRSKVVPCFARWQKTKNKRTRVQPCSCVWILFASTILALVFSLGAFLNFPPANAENISLTKNNYIEHEVVAKIAADADANAIAMKYNLQIEFLKSSTDGNLYILKSPSGFTTKKLISLLQKNSQIISVQPNFKYKLLARVPNDPQFSKEWPLAETTSIAGGVSAPSAWDLETKNKNKIPIAVIDTGVSDKQPEIAKMITGGKAKGRNIDNPKKKPTDSDGHGTFLAGIIAAQTNNKKGIAGASFFGNLKIMPLKFDFTTDQAISAVSYAKARNIPIINASWGAYGEEGLDLGAERRNRQLSRSIRHRGGKRRPENISSDTTTTGATPTKKCILAISTSRTSSAWQPAEKMAR